MAKALSLVLLALLPLLPARSQRTAAQGSRDPGTFLEEATVAQLQAWMRDGRYTSRQLTDAYLDRIDAIDRRGPTLRAVIEINPEARSIADGLDRERRANRLRGPLHGIP